MTRSSPFISSCTRNQLSRRRFTGHGGPGLRLGGSGRLVASRALQVALVLIIVIGSFLAGYGTL